MDQSLVIEASELEQLVGETQQNLEFVNSQLAELESFQLSLEHMEKTKEKNLLAPIGKGVYVDSEIKDFNLFVEVGAGIVIKKTIAQTLSVVEDQISKLKEAKFHLSGQMDSYAMRMQEILAKFSSK
jgi:prefoldin alpha subunit